MIQKKMSIELFDDYFEGKDCVCAAHGEAECCCGANWTCKLQKLVEAWLNMPAQEIRSVKAVLSQILKSK